MIIEVVSEHKTSHDYVRKLNLYNQFKVKEYLDKYSFVCSFRTGFLTFNLYLMFRCQIAVRI
ncbi:hypothetical protein CaldiYA01_06320 [Caldicellulosiruptor diazotrophicus]|uniref:Uncharacterized protein n=1 Tax=Caldicellulosiruptor diazotrophicus TaxID=2806205 RepID=A0ABM7NKQ5_9FIRM|nr:hypothetical protein CaldiYA01_06320 [Caldicellulosiruptor diazotrophicus]